MNTIKMQPFQDIISDATRHYIRT